MKQSIFTIALMTVIIFGTFAGTTKKARKANYIVTEEGITYVTKLKVGINHTLITEDESGEKVKYSAENVKAYRKNGKEYKRFYKVNQGSNYVSRTFMQKLFSRAGYTLYRNGTDFYVYSGEQEELKINKENYKVVLSFFFPKFNLKFS